MKKIKLSDYSITSNFTLEDIPNGRILVNTINAYSWVMADKDPLFKRALIESDYLLPDGVSITWAARFINKESVPKFAGADLHKLLLEVLNRKKGKCFYLGASDQTLSQIKEHLALEYPNVGVCTYSPPYKTSFSLSDNQKMIEAINDFEPDVLFVGMTAPKQEKWIIENASFVKAHVITGIGAVFDFYAGTKERPAQWMIDWGLEWLGRLISDPKRLWKRYVVYNPVFVYKILKIKYGF